MSILRALSLSSHLKSRQILIHIVLTLGCDHIRSGGRGSPLSSRPGAARLLLLLWRSLVVGGVAPLEGPGRRGPVPPPGRERPGRGSMSEPLPGDGDRAVAGGQELVLVLVLGHGPEHSGVRSVTGRSPAREIRGTRGHSARSHPGGEQEVAGARHPPDPLDPLPVADRGLRSLPVEARPGPGPGAVSPGWSCRHFSTVKFVLLSPLLSWPGVYLTTPSYNVIRPLWRSLFINSRSLSRGNKNRNVEILMTRGRTLWCLERERERGGRDICLRLPSYLRHQKTDSFKQLTANTEVKHSCYMWRPQYCPLYKKCLLPPSHVITYYNVRSGCCRAGDWDERRWYKSKTCLISCCLLSLSCRPAWAEPV